MANEDKDNIVGGEPQAGLGGYIRPPQRRRRKYLQQDDRALKLIKPVFSQQEQPASAQQNAAAAQDGPGRNIAGQVFSHVRPAGGAQEQVSAQNVPAAGGRQNGAGADGKNVQAPAQNNQASAGAQKRAPSLREQFKILFLEFLDSSAVYVFNKFVKKHNLKDVRSLIKSSLITLISVSLIFLTVTFTNWRDAKWREEFDKKREARIKAAAIIKSRPELTAQQQMEEQEASRRRRLQKLGTFMPVEEELSEERQMSSTALLQQAIEDDKDRIRLAGSSEYESVAPDVNYSAQVAAYREQVRKQKEAEKAEAERQAAILAEKKKQEEAALSKARAAKEKQIALEKAAKQGKEITPQGQVVTKVNKLQTSKGAGPDAKIFKESKDFKPID